MRFLEYLALADEELLSATLVFDRAISAEKMCHPANATQDNQAWSKGPFLASPANMPEIDHSYPYIMATSLYSQMAAKMTVGMHPDRDESGGVKFPHGPYDALSIKRFISRSIIIHQHLLLESYEFSLHESWLESQVVQLDAEKFTLKDFEDKGIVRLKRGRVDHHLKRYTSSGVRKRLEEKLKVHFPTDPLLEVYIEHYEKLSLRRNNLVHSVSARPSDMKEAIEYCYATRRIAQVLGRYHGDQDAIDWVPPDASS